MNYFELYKIEEAIVLDKNEIKKKFLELSRTYHPDFYGNESEEKQQEALEFSTLNTNAFNTFKSQQKTIEYILNLHQLLEEIPQLPPEFLMIMMEVNEALMELEFDFDEDVYTKIKKEVEGIENELSFQLQKIESEFTSKDKTEVLEKLKDYYLKNKYLLRIKETLNKFASRS